MAQEPGADPSARRDEEIPDAPTELSDLATLKALAQPRRQRMLQHLTVQGPATSATLARALGLNTGATSYHLRELARYGFVEEVDQPTETGGGHGRERWWRAVPGDRRFPPRSRQSPEMRLVMDELNHHAYAADLELFEQIQMQMRPRTTQSKTQPQQGPQPQQVQGETGEADPWADAFPYSRGSVRLTLPELRTFFEEYIALLNRYKRPEADTPPDARTVLTRFLAFPAPDPAPESEPAPHNGTESAPS